VNGTAFQVLGILNGTAFYVLGICLAILALAVTAIGLRDSKAFSSNTAARAGIAVFAVLVVGTVTFAVRYSRNEQTDRRAKLAAEEKQQGAQGGAAAPSQPSSQGKQPTVKGPGGTVKLAADPTQIAYTSKALSSKPGKVTIDLTNPAPIQHDVAIAKGSQQLAKAPLVSNGSTSVTADLASGKYIFYCTVPGHRQAGMQGTLTVK
jgi:plastocyanin